jgi:MFS family permease
MPVEGAPQQRRLLFLLTCILAVNQLDRHIVNICLAAIGAEFSLTDTQLGLLAGPAFMAAYVIFGFPLAYLAVRFDRRNIVAVSMIAWSSLTLLTGLAQSFVQLVLLRIGVGIGESGAVATSHAMISDLYPPERRASALSTFMTGANIGLLLAFLIGGLVTQTLGWRYAFIFAGLPGLVLAGILFATTRDPERRIRAGESSDRSALLRRTLMRMVRDPGLRNLAFAMGINGIVTFAMLTWTATFLMRVHEIPPLAAGIIIAFVVGVAGGLGTFLSGRIADRLARRDPRNRMLMLVVANILAKPFVLAFLLTDWLLPGGIALSISVFLSSVYWGPALAHLHGEVETVMRPMATTMILFCYNVFGVVAGPLIVGAVSDLVGDTSTGAGLQLGLITVQLAGLVSALCFWNVRRSMAAPQIATARG